MDLRSRPPSESEVDPGEVINDSFVSNVSARGALNADLHLMAEQLLRQTAEASTPHTNAQSTGGSIAASEAGHDAPEVEDETAFQIAMRYVKTGYPLTISTLFQFTINTVIISVVGKYLGVEELDGTSLALGLVNATGLAFGAGLCGALETVLSHTYGNYMRKQQTVKEARERYLQDHPDAELPPLIEYPLYMYGIYAQRMCVILFVFAFPLGIVLSYADKILSALGATKEVVHFTGIWCRLAVFGIPATLLFQLLTRYFSCQHHTLPLSVALVSAAVANPLLQIAFVWMFGFAGSPIAWLLLMSLIVAGLLLYLWRSGLYKKTWGGWSKKGLHNIGDLLSIALPSMAVMLSEWVALEVNALAGGFTDAISLAGYSITLQIFGIMWGIGSGVMILSCVFVGNAIGEGRPYFARKVAYVAVALMFCISVIDVLLVIAVGPIIPYLFTDDKRVADVYHRLMYVVLPYHFFDTFQSTTMGILRGCGLQKLGAVVICTAFCVVGVPLSFLLFFYFKIGVIALWIGPFLGVLCIGTPVYIYLLLFYIDWVNLKPHEDDNAGDDDHHDQLQGLDGQAALPNGRLNSKKNRPATDKLAAADLALQQNKMQTDVVDTQSADHGLSPP